MKKPFISGIFDDEGNPIDSSKLIKPLLCIGCKSNTDTFESYLCDLTRFDQRNDTKFVCHAFEPLHEI